MLLVCLTEKAEALKSTQFPEPVLDWRGGKDDLLSHDHHLLLQKGFFYMLVQYISVKKLYVLSEAEQAEASYCNFFCVLYCLLRTSRKVFPFLFAQCKKLIQVNQVWVSDIYVLCQIRNYLLFDRI